MKLIDLHCDTVWKLMDLDQSGDLMENGCSVSIPGMRTAGTRAQFFACFTYAEDYKDQGGYDAAYEHACRMADYLTEQTEQYKEDIGLAHSYEEMVCLTGQNRISAFLTVEDGGILNGRIQRLDHLYRKGIRLMTLMWNYENCLGHPNSRESSVMWQGLKPFGIETVHHMNELGMIVDVSHASDGVVRDVLEHSAYPIVASHSNCREICNHPRNLPDELIRRIANGGGIAGLNFYGPFLGDPKASRVEEMAAHVLHMIQVGGSEFPAVGTDFDGFDGMEILEIPDVSKMERLWDTLKKWGVSERQLDKIWGDNAQRILRQIL